MQRFTFVASLLLISVALIWPKFYDSFNDKTALAVVTSSKGTTEWISRQNLSGKIPEKALDIQINESLATGTDGEIGLRFKRGAEIRLLPGSFITLTKKANSTLIALRRGEIEVIKEGEANSILVTQNGEDRPLRDYVTPESSPSLALESQSFAGTKTVEPISESSNEINTSVESQASEPPIAGPALNTASDPLTPVTPQIAKNLQEQIRRMIADRVSRQRNHLFRCYTTLIQKQKDAEGKLNLHFIVNTMGKVEDPMIVKTEIPDKKFEACLLQIIKRTDFQPFQGQKVSTYLPLRFDKNLTSTVE